MLTKSLNINDMTIPTRNITADAELHHTVGKVRTFGHNLNKLFTLDAYFKNLLNQVWLCKNYAMVESISNIKLIVFKQYYGVKLRMLREVSILITLECMSYITRTEPHVMAVDIN